MSNEPVDSQFTDAMIRSLRVTSQLLLDFFVTFSRFEYALKAAGFRMDLPANAADVSWDKFKNWLESLEAAELDSVVDAGGYLISNPPRRLVVLNGVLSWEVASHGGQSDIRFLVGGLARARNNLFHGGKWLTAPEPSDRNERVISTALHVLHALVNLPSAHEIRRHFLEVP